MSEDTKLATNLAKHSNFEMLYTLNDACKILGTSRKTVVRLIDDGKIKAARVGNRYRIKESTIHNFLNGE